MPPSEPLSSPALGHASPGESLQWYKSQYEQLETELAEFRLSSEELEKELERDLDAAEKRERALRQKAEGLNYEVDEWKRKYKDSKNEANAVQCTLEKEITTLRDANRTLQHKLRDIEVANDDFERQARITDSSLEDMETKYNTAIERLVMMEEENKIGEQEREQLRIEAQRLREELSDLRIEADILQDKIKKGVEQRHTSTLSTDLSLPGSPMFDNSTRSGASSPLLTTPPETSSICSSKTPANEPPSPPMSDASAPLPDSHPIPKLPAIKTTMLARSKKTRLPPMDSSRTPKSMMSSVSRTATARPAATTAPTTTTSQHPATSRNSNVPRSAVPKTTSTRAPPDRIAPSTSLTHIRSLTAQMQRLEARVQSVRSKLPAPAITPPHLSRAPAHSNSTRTIKSRKRAPSSVSSTTPTITNREDATPGARGSAINSSKHVSPLRTSGATRRSFGPLPMRCPIDSGSEVSRPSSRASISSYARPLSRADGRNDSMIAPLRPVSRAGGRRTPMDRPTSRMSLGSSLHGHSMSLALSMAEEEEPLELDYRTPRTPSRRGVYSRADSATGIPTPSGIPIPSSRRPSLSSPHTGPMRRPSLGPTMHNKSSTKPAVVDHLGETF